MNAHRIETTLTEDRRLTLEDLPFQAGDTVEVIVRESGAAALALNREAQPETDWNLLNQILDAGRVDAGIPDLAHQHDHYLHGHPKRS